MKITYHRIQMVIKRWKDPKVKGTLSTLEGDYQVKNGLVDSSFPLYSTAEDTIRGLTDEKFIQGLQNAYVSSEKVTSSRSTSAKATLKPLSKSKTTGTSSGGCLF